MFFFLCFLGPFFMPYYLAEYYIRKLIDQFERVNAS